MPHNEVQAYYDLVDILVYPRLPMRLTDLVTPLKPLEAMAEGRLVVASDVGGHRELIKDGVTGRLFPAGDAAALAACVTEMLADELARRQSERLDDALSAEERNWRRAWRYQAIYAAAADGAAWYAVSKHAQRCLHFQLIVPEQRADPRRGCSSGSGCAR